MPKKINLIPSDLAVKSSTNKLGKTISTLSVVGAIMLVVATISVLGFTIYYNGKLKALNTSIDTLKRQIVALEASEQKLVLAKDRLEKINDIRKQDTANEEIAVYKQMANNASSDILFSEVSLEGKKVEGSIITPSSTSLSSFFDQLSLLTGVKTVLLSTLSFNPTSGYLASLVFNTTVGGAAK